MLDRNDRFDGNKNRVLCYLEQLKINSSTINYYIYLFSVFFMFEVHSTTK